MKEASEDVDTKKKEVADLKATLHQSKVLLSVSPLLPQFKPILTM